MFLRKRGKKKAITVLKHVCRRYKNNRFEGHGIHTVNPASSVNLLSVNFFFHPWNDRQLLSMIACLADTLSRAVCDRSAGILVTFSTVVFYRKKWIDIQLSVFVEDIVG
jgi:hypothetical protein